MKETEVKILEIDSRRVISRLKALGAKQVFSGRIEAFYFDLPGRKLTRQKAIFRLRKKGRHSELAFKKMRSQYKAKVMDEFEVLVHDFRIAKKIVEGLGFRIIRQIRKSRRSFVLGPIRFEIDKHPGIPALLEIEGPTAGEIRKWVERLGYPVADAKAWSCFDVLRYYRK